MAPQTADAEDVAVQTRDTDSSRALSLTSDIYWAMNLISSVVLCVSVKLTMHMFFVFKL